MTADVQVQRRLFSHSEAEIVIPWHENGDYDSRDAARISASAMNCPIDVTWRDNDLAESTPVFRGFVQIAHCSLTPASSSIVLHAVSNSQRTDALPRYRAFQELSLLEIAQHIAKTEPLVKIEQTAALAGIHIPLSLQYGETNFGYLSRMCQAWNVPLMVHDLTGNIFWVQKPGNRAKTSQTPTLAGARSGSREKCMFQCRSRVSQRACRD